MGSYDDQLKADDFTELTSTANSRENFLTEVLRVVDKFNVHGVLFQWHYPGCPKVGELVGRTIFQLSQAIFLRQSSCKDANKIDKENIIAMANEIFQPLRNRGLIVMLNQVLSFDVFNYLGERSNHIF
jgi:GH18 family chitinase